MSARKVKRTRDKRLYIMYERRRMFAPVNTVIEYDDEVHIRHHAPDGDENKVGIGRFGPRYEVTTTRPAWSPSGTVQQSYSYWTQSMDPVHGGVQEVWTTTEERPIIKERLKDGQVHLAVQANGTKTTVMVGADGINYRTWNKEATRYQKSTKGCNVLVPSAALFTWDEWAELVIAVANAREQVELGPIRTKLEEEIAAEDAMREWLKEKGLVDKSD